MQVGHKVLAVVCWLIVQTVHGGGRQLQTTDGTGTSQDTATRDEAEAVEEVPGGMRLKEALPSPIPLKLIPNWDLFLGFEDRSKVIRGKLTLSIFYYPEAKTYVSDPQKIVSVDNFGDGDRILQSTVTLIEPGTADREAIATSNIYVGDFSQSQSMFDHSCYPFDTKKVKFEISIQRPGDYIFTLEMMCPGPKIAEYIKDDKNNTRIVKCMSESMGSFVGFDWGSFTCEYINGQQMLCYIDGTRQWLSVFKGHIWPSFTFSAMGFLSFALSVKMAMPRIATTMLALVSLTSLRNSVMQMLPGSGSTSWLEEYFLISMTFMLLNLCGHAFSFYLDAKGKVAAQKMVNQINFWGMVTVCFFVSVLRLHERDCPLVNRTLSTFLVVSSGLLVVCVFSAIAWIHAAARQEVIAILRELIRGKSEKDLEL